MAALGLPARRPRQHPLNYVSETFGVVARAGTAKVRDADGYVVVACDLGGAVPDAG
jgi:hypothetical protein